MLGMLGMLGVTGEFGEAGVPGRLGAPGRLGTPGTTGIVGTLRVPGRVGTLGLSGGVLGNPGVPGTTTVTVGAGGLRMLFTSGTGGTVTVETEVAVTKTVDPVGGNGPCGLLGGAGPGGNGKVIKGDEWMMSPP
jgi:hypothetical protein